MKAEQPPIEARTAGERLALLLFLFVLVALPLGLLLGSVASAVTGETIFDALANAVLLHFGLSLLGVPGVVAYWIVLEVTRRRAIHIDRADVLALPLVASPWSILPGWHLFSDVPGLFTVVFTVIVFGWLVRVCRTKRAL